MIEFRVEGMTCGHCVSAVTRAVKAVDPEANVRVDLEAKAGGRRGPEFRRRAEQGACRRGLPCRAGWRAGTGSAEEHWLLRRVDALRQRETQRAGPRAGVRRDRP